jgi:hypothetical protein
VTPSGNRLKHLGLINHHICGMRATSQKEPRSHD